MRALAQKQMPADAREQLERTVDRLAAPAPVRNKRRIIDCDRHL